MCETSTVRAMAPELPTAHRAPWTEVALEDIVTNTKLGTTARGADADGRNLPLIKMGNLIWGGVDLRDIEPIAISLVDGQDVLANHGDLLFNTRNSASLVGKSAVWRKEFGMAAFDNNINRISLDGRCVPEFYAAHLNTGAGKRSVQELAVGSTSVAAIYWKDLKKLPVPLPPKEEQRKIAEILQTWDQAIEKLEAVRAAKSSRLKALTRLLVFGGSRLADYDVKAAKVSHRWFALPADWACVPIIGVAREIAERHNSGGDYEVLSCSKYDGFVRSLEYFKKQVFSADLDGYKKIWRSDFGFPSNHVEEGSIGLQNLVEVGLVSPIYTVFRFEPNTVLPEYAFAVLKTGLYRHIFEVSTSASVDRRGSLRWTEFSKIPFPLPSMAEQKAIIEVLHTSKAEIDILDKEIEAVTRQKRGLMQRLLTGEWRVKLDGDEGFSA